MDNQGNSSDHPIFTRDPAEDMQYLYKEVCITTEDDRQHTGWVHTIDPVSQSVVLVQFRKDCNNSMQIVMGHAIQSIIILDENTQTHKSELDALFRTTSGKDLTPEELKEKQELLRQWLCKNRIPVAVSGENSEVLSISDALSIEPPYGPENCRSTNEIILGRVQGLIKNMPVDVKDW